MVKVQTRERSPVRLALPSIPGRRPGTRTPGAVHRGQGPDPEAVPGPPGVTLDSWKASRQRDTWSGPPWSRPRPGSGPRSRWCCPRSLEGVQAPGHRDTGSGPRGQGQTRERSPVRLVCPRSPGSRPGPGHRDTGTPGHRERSTRSRWTRERSPVPLALPSIPWKASRHRDTGSGPRGQGQTRERSPVRLVLPLVTRNAAPSAVNGVKNYIQELGHS